MKKITAILIAMLAALPVSAEPVDTSTDYFPQQMSARKLLDACASSAMTSAGRERRRYCAGFVSGVEEAVRHLQEQHQLQSSVCLPEGVSAKALANTFIRYAANRQAELDRPAAAIVLEALREGYPCGPAGSWRLLEKYLTKTG